MTVGYSEMGTRVGTVGYGRAAPQTGFTSCQIGDIGASVCVYSPGTFSVICAELLPQELTSVSPHVIIAQSDYEEGEGERGRGREGGGVRDSIFRTNRRSRDEM